VRQPSQMKELADSHPPVWLVAAGFSRLTGVIYYLQSGEHRVMLTVSAPILLSLAFALIAGGNSLFGLFLGAASRSARSPTASIFCTAWRFSTAP